MKFHITDNRPPHQLIGGCFFISIAIIVMLLACSFPGKAQSENKPLFKSTGAFFALSVPDLEASIKWYTSNLGLKVVNQPPKQGKFSVAILEGGDLIVELIQNDDAQSLATVAPSVKDNIFIHGAFKTGVIVDDLDKMVALLTERGVAIFMGPFPARENQKANVLIKDNNGNIIQFIAKG